MRRDSDISYYMDLDLYAKGERIFDDIYNERYLGKKYVTHKKYGGISPNYFLTLRDVLNVRDEKQKIGSMHYFSSSYYLGEIWLMDIITFTSQENTFAPLNYLVYDPKFKLKLQLSGLLPEIVTELIYVFESDDVYLIGHLKHSSVTVGVY